MTVLALPLTHNTYPVCNEIYNYGREICGLKKSSQLRFCLSMSKEENV